MSDSEVTLSAMSGEEQGGGREQNYREASKKASATSLARNRKKKRLHSNPKRRRSVRSGGDAPGPNCTSERVSQEVAMKATQARKLLAKVRGGISYCGMV